MALKAKSKKPTSEESGVLFIRGVSPEILAALDARVAELRSVSSLYAGLSRSSLVLNVLETVTQEWTKTREVK